MHTRRGRRPGVATIDYTNDATVELRRQFYEACAGLRYGERAALARGLGVSRSTVDKWKCKVSFPKYAIVMQVIAWVKNGKPMKHEAPWLSEIDMF
jgi:transcriptional regulator with XRE-family HTH domain